MLTALVKVAMIGTWRGRTFLDDNLVLDDVADFVPEEPAAPVQLSVSAVTGNASQAPAAAAAHSVAA
jgi:hypothetical protein